MPADYLERPANHRESILNLPDVTKPQLAEFYDRFTALHQRLALRRLGTAFPAGLATATEGVLERLARTA